MKSETHEPNLPKLFLPPKNFLLRQTKLFWIMTLSLIFGSIFILHALQGYFLTDFFKILIAVQIFWCTGIILFLRKMIFAWHGMTVTADESEITIEKNHKKTTYSYASMQKLVVEMRNQQISAFKLETNAEDRPIRIHVDDAEAFYQILKVKIGNPFKIALQTPAPLRGLARFAVPVLPVFIFLVMSFRAFMAFEAISMRPDLGISYESWLFLMIFEFSLGTALATQVWQRKRLAYGVSLLIGTIFLFGIVCAILAVDLKDAPHWYEVLFLVYAGVLALADLTALFLVVANPPARLETHDLGMEAANPLS